MFYLYTQNQLHARQRESSVKTLRSPLFSFVPEFFKALRVEWGNSTPDFYFGNKAKK